MDENAYMEALVVLHTGLDRQGPGDLALSQALLDNLPPLPSPPRIADLGCGAGASALMLAERFQTRVTAVDLNRVFVLQLEEAARQRGLSHLVQAEQDDMGTLDWPPGCLDLIWSEGAAYLLTFAGALTKWRPLLAPKGLAVISECTWFEADPPRALREFWDAAYPTMATEEQNITHALQTGYEVLHTKRLPVAAWWDSYYTPLQERMEALRNESDAAMQQVIAETEAEIAFFEQYGDSYGYSFYVLQRSD